MKLIYHAIHESGLVSPFDETLMKVARDASPLLLASPYIGLSSVVRVTQAASDWRLLSDIEAWLGAGNKRHRTKCWDFIEDNIDRIRHVPDLHAKVAIGNHMLFLGSANFTDKGLLERTEFSVLIEEEDQVSEATAWFEALWGTASPPVIEEGDSLIEILNETRQSLIRSKIRLTATTQVVRSVLSKSDRPEGFDVVAEVAKYELAESERYLTLENAYHEVSDTLFKQARSFTFSDLVNKIGQFYPNPTLRDIWGLVVAETTNHFLGGIMEDGFDRYCYVDGMFVHWQANHLTAVSFIDQYLHFLIHTLPMNNETDYLPLEDAWLEVGIPTHHILMILDYLLQIGFLIEHDMAGNIQQYSIDTEFEWPHRWKKFAKSHALFQQKVHSNKVLIQDVELEEEEPDEFGTESDFLLGLRHRQEIGLTGMDPGYQNLKSELEGTAKILQIDTQELLMARETSLVYAFELIKDRLATITNAELDSLVQELSRQNLPPKLMLEFRLYNRGAFVRLKKGGRIKPSSVWLATHHLALYPRALKAWRRLF
jgi:hypothetical protein